MLLAVLIPLLDLLWHHNSVFKLSDLTTAASGNGQRLPRLSVIVPACNEEAGVRAAVASMIRQDYPDLEIVLVNDRSTDRTGEIMAELAAAHSGRVSLVNVTELPPGWLGKNHALWVGTRQATGEWFLFADADVHFDPTCFRRAVVHGEAAHLDHLTLLPGMHTRGYWLNAFIEFFIYGFLIFKRPYRANDPTSKVGMGIGAFNLISRSAYDRVGTHAAISLRPDDDLRLGQRVKLMGLRQQVADGSDLMGLEWYPSLGEAIRGLEKNAFAGLNYSVLQVIGSVLSLLLLYVYPYGAIWWAAGPDRSLLLGLIGLNTLSFAVANWKTNRLAILHAAAFPVLALLFAYTVARSTALALLQGGIRWRGTLYPLHLLKAQSGLEF